MFLVLKALKNLEMPKSLNSLEHLDEGKGEEKGPCMFLLSTHLLFRQKFHKLGNDVLGSSQWLMSS